MSSESRSERLEEILAAKYELDGCADEEKHECADAFNRLVDAVLKDHPQVSRYDLLEAISERYREYRAARLKAQRRRDTL